MKSILFIIALSVFGVVSVAQNNYPIYSNCSSVPELNCEVLSNNSISIPCDFAKSHLQFPTIELSNKEVIKVTYCYSANTKNPDFEQNSLSNERYQKLIEKYPQLKNPNIEWETFAQTKCAGKSCVEELFHGFLIEYKILEMALIPKGDKGVFKSGHNNLPVQKHVMNTNKSNIIKGDKGTLIYIPENSFVDKKGNPVHGEVELTLKEAVDLEDIVLGNMTTMTDKGELLMSKGMIYIVAYSNGNELELGAGKELVVEMPMEYEEGYSYFQGDENLEGEVKWTNPKPMNADKILDPFEAVRGQVDLRTYISDMFKIEKNEANVITKITIPIRSEEVVFTRETFTRREGLREGLKKYECKIVKSWFENNEVDYGELWFKRNRYFRFFGRVYNLRSSNIGPLTTKKISKVEKNRFGLDKMGWANIDCMHRFENAEPMVLEAYNASGGIDDLAISLIIPSINSMIPGFQLSNGNFSFTHGEYEKFVPYPRGEEAYVFAVAEKDGESYASLHKFAFGDNEVEKFELIKSDEEATKRLIRKAF